jgi:hypothetical protein
MQAAPRRRLFRLWRWRANHLAIARFSTAKKWKPALLQSVDAATVTETGIFDVKTL